MRPDSEIKSGVEAELRCHPDVDDSGIAVNVEEGTVTLMGYVPDFFQKYGAEDAVKRVAGVAAVANEIQVRSPTSANTTDPQIARACLASIKELLPLRAAAQIRPIVRQGIVTLEGTVATDAQRTHAEAAVRKLTGVVGIINTLTLAPGTTPSTEWLKQTIEERLRRGRVPNASRIGVEINAANVILSGRVSTWAERRWAEECAAAVAGVQAVSNELLVRHPELPEDLLGALHNDTH